MEHFFPLSLLRRPWATLLAFYCAKSSKAAYAATRTYLRSAAKRSSTPTIFSVRESHLIVAHEITNVDQRATLAHDRARSNHNRALDACL